MSAPLRVLSVINELYFGGDENRLLTMARTMDRDRVNVDVVTLKRADEHVDSHYGTMRSQYRDAGVDVIDLGEGHPNEGVPIGSPLRMWRSAEMFARTVGAVCRFIRGADVDVVDAHLGPGNLVGVTAGVLTGTPRVVTTYHVEQWDPRWMWFAVHQWTLANADAIITDSHACAETIRRWMRKRDPNILVIPNGVATPVSDRAKDELRASFGLPMDPDVRIVGQISTLLPTKGHMIMIDAARRIRDRFPNTAFLLVGYVREDPSYKEKLEARAAELGLGDRLRIVSYPGPIGDVWKVIDVHAHPTLLDSLPNAIIEGMSLGRPAVVSAVGGIPALVDDGITGFVVPPNDANALAAAVGRILDDPDLGKRLGDGARRRYESGYTPQIMASRLENAFASVSKKKGRRRSPESVPSP
ncbi:MAG TPA: glycosyltransferase family 4 protein [Candidatus Eremiobacteraceae bacterium]|jgi:glycosyltransferase involved in cell wall biosynthesis